MAEHKIDDTKAPAAPRGARPFAGPAAPSAARPFLRPAAPAARPSGAPFAPPSGTRPATSRPSLGVSAPASRPAPTPTPIPVQAVENAVPTLRPTDGGSSFRPTDGGSSFGITLGHQAAETPLPDPLATYEPVTELVAAPPTEVVPPIEEVAAVEEAEPAALESPRRRVTSEMVALDAFDAFDDVWGGSDTVGNAAAAAPPPSPLDQAALGSGSDAECLWADEASAAAEAAVAPETGRAAQGPDVEGAWPVADAEMPAWLADDDTAVTAGQSSGDWSEMPAIPSADDVIAMPPVDNVIGVDDVAHAASSEETLGADPAASPADPVPDQMATPFAAASDVWPDQLLAEYAPYAAPSPETPTQVAAVTADAPVADATPDTVGVEAVPEAEHSLAAPVHTDAGELLDAPTATEAKPSAGSYVSATLDRLAERVRRGEIDISSVAPEATEAAVLASVLATLLGGSNSR